LPRGIAARAGGKKSGSWEESRIPSQGDETKPHMYGEGESTKGGAGVAREQRQENSGSRTLNRDREKRPGKK